MSRTKLCAHIPFEIQAEIMKRLPVESLIRFKDVSKAWKSLIGSSKFINDHYVHQTQTQPQHLLLIYKVNGDPTYVSLIDNDTFPNHKFSHMVPKGIKQVKLSRVYGSSRGMLCTFGYYKLDICSSYMAVLWNPIVKKSVGIVIPKSGSSTRLSLGFGVCPITNDPKIVDITIPEKPCVHWEIQVFTLSSRAWKSVFIDPPSKLCHFRDHFPIEGFVYWLGCGEFGSTNFIIYFDLTSEEFGEVCLPDNLVHSKELAISKREKTLVVLDCCYPSEISDCDVWMMKDCVTKSLTKMFTIKSPCDRIVLGFRMNGEAITEIIDHGGNSMLEVYESCSGDFNAIGIQGDHLSFYVSSYTGSLLLLDQSDSIIHGNGTDMKILYHLV